MEQDRFNRKVDPTVDRNAEFRRVEVITGVGRRRQWPEEVKARIVMESFADGAVISEVAQRHGLRPQQLFDWRRRFRQSLPATEVPEPVSFAPVIVDRPVPMPTEASASAMSVAASTESRLRLARQPFACVALSMRRL